MISKATSSKVRTQASYRKLNGIGTQIHPVYLGWIVGWSVHNMIAQQRRFAGVRLAGRLPRDPDRLQHGDGLHIPGWHRGQQLWTGGGNTNVSEWSSSKPINILGIDSGLNYFTHRWEIWPAESSSAIRVTVRAARKMWSWQSGKRILKVRACL